MEVQFSYQYAPLLGLILGLLFGITIYSRKMKKARAMKFGNYETLEKVAGGNFLRTSNVLAFLKLAAITCLIIGVSGPQLVKDTSVADASYVIAIDSSSSMFTDDIEPTRFQTAKDIATGLVDEMTNQTELGLVSYAGDVKTVSDISGNLPEKKRSIREMEIGDTAGTAIGDAVISSGTLLQNSTAPKRIVLITDGENNVGSGVNESIRFANNNNISVYAVGLGKNREGNQYEVINGNNASKADFPNLNEDELERLSNSTGGESVFVSNNTELNPEFIGIEEKETAQDFSTAFIFLGAILLILEWILKSTGLEILP